jgi:hypothetical protein
MKTYFLLIYISRTLETIEALRMNSGMQVSFLMVIYFVLIHIFRIDLIDPTLIDSGVQVLSLTMPCFVLIYIVRPQDLTKSRRIDSET